MESSLSHLGIEARNRDLESWNPGIEAWPGIEARSRRREKPPKSCLGPETTPKQAEAETPKSV